jgi:hypothetical protein
MDEALICRRPTKKGSLRKCDIVVQIWKQILQLILLPKWAFPIHVGSDRRERMTGLWHVIKMAEPLQPKW